MPSRRVSNLLDKFVAAENDFLNREFLAPVVRGGDVRVRIAGVALAMRTMPADFEGWGVFCPISHREALLSRTATMAERAKYVGVLKSSRRIVCDRTKAGWVTLPANPENSGHRPAETSKPALVRLADGVQLFDTIHVGFDGVNQWFDHIDTRCDLAMAAWLRTALAAAVASKDLARKGLTAQHRAAYALHCFVQEKAKQDKPEPRDEIEVQLRDALGHAGAEFVNYAEHRDGYRVTYNVGSARHTSSVAKNDLTVQTAGICLAGEDRKFDLASLVSVLREPDAQDAW